MNVKGRSAKPHLAIENIISQVRKIAPMKEDNNIPPHVPMQENHMLKRQNNGNGVKATRRLDQSIYIYIYIYIYMRANIPFSNDLSSLIHGQMIYHFLKIVEAEEKTQKLEIYFFIFFMIVELERQKSHRLLGFLFLFGK
jgi:hypothetical protein